MSARLLRLPCWLLFTLMYLGWALELLGWLAPSMRAPDFVGDALEVIGTGLFAAWYLAAFRALQPHQPAPPPLGTGSLVFLGSVLAFALVVVQMAYTPGFDSPLPGPWATALGVVALWAYLTAHAFLPRALASAERRRAARLLGPSADRYLGDYLLTLFFVIGVWVLPGRVRRVLTRSEQKHES